MIADDVEVVEEEIRKAIEYQHHVGVAGALIMTAPLNVLLYSYSIH